MKNTTNKFTTTPVYVALIITTFMIAAKIESIEIKGEQKKAIQWADQEREYMQQYELEPYTS